MRRITFGANLVVLGFGGLYEKTSEEESGLGHDSRTG